MNNNNNTVPSLRSIADLPLLSGRQDEYLRYLGFQRNPFPVAPDVEHLFLPPQTDTLLTEILHGIYTRKGFMVITGEVGLGKTTLSQHILNILEEDGKVETALVLNTFLQGTELLSEIIRDFGLQTEEFTHQGQLMVLNNFLIERYQSGSNCCVIIDDAQNLSLESLELVRMISNLETNASKLVQILLVGQPEFEEKLEAHSLRQLKSRIMIHATVEPLDRDALRQYVFFKMSAAGDSGGVLVPENCFNLIHKLTAGNPRLVNRLMDRTLYGLFAYNTTQVSRRLLMEVSTEMGLSVPKIGWWQQSARVAVAAFAMIGLISVMLTGKQWLDHPTETSKIEISKTEISKTETSNIETSNIEISNIKTSKIEASKTEISNIEGQQANIRDTDANTYLQRKNTFRPPEQLTSTTSSVPLEVQQFLGYYGLESYAEHFTQALEVGFGPVAQRIWEERGYRLVQLPERMENIQGPYRVLRRYSADGNGGGKRMLFWRPNYWIETFAPGEKSEKIIALQRQLAQVNFYHAHADGIVGNQTMASLTGFQKYHQLPITGQPDAATLFLLSQIAGDFQWSIQIASLQRLEDASALVNALIRKGFKSFIKPLKSDDGQAWQVVRVGPLNSYADAKAQQRDILTKLRLTGKIVQSLSMVQETRHRG